MAGLWGEKIALLAYDTLLTANAEIEHIWRGRFNGVKFFYIFNRYTYIAETFFNIMLALAPQNILVRYTIFKYFGKF